MRTIKSFVLRGGRISNRQRQGLEKYLSNYELNLPLPWDLKQIFGREADTVIDIGFGMGAALRMTAEQNLKLNFIGIEVHQAGIGSLAAELHEKSINNVRIINGDAVEVFKQHIREESLAGVQIFFPDPWPKKRHHKRRLIQSEFITLVAKKIKPGGFIHCATDWQDYAEQMLAILSAERQLQNLQAQGGFCQRPESRPLTKFEQRGTKLGHGVWDLIFKKKIQSPKSSILTALE